MRELRAFRRFAIAGAVVLAALAALAAPALAQLAGSGPLPAP